MKTYLSHFTALQKWGIPFLESVLNTKELRNRLSSSDIEITATNTASRYRRKGYIVHICELDLPKGAVVNRDGTFIASPELVFLQLANKLDIHRLILLGILMCSHDVRKASEAVTTKRKLMAFIKKTSGHRGHRKALRALKYIEDGAASYQEAVLFMILRLPNLLGGFGLKGAKFNQEILLEKKGRSKLKQKKCFADIYYGKEKLAVEYDSLENHGTAKEQAKDYMRASALERQGISVVGCSTLQLYDKKACEEFVANVAGRLRRRIRIRTKRFVKAHKNLRFLLQRNSLSVL